MLRSDVPTRHPIRLAEVLACHAIPCRPIARPLTFSASREVRATRDAVWAVMGDFGNEHRWTKTLSSCSRDTPTVRVGTVRHCLLPKPLMGRTEVFETLIELHPGTSLGYTLDGPAGPSAQSAGRSTVVPAGPTARP